MRRAAAAAALVVSGAVTAALLLARPAHGAAGAPAPTGAPAPAGATTRPATAATNPRTTAPTPAGTADASTPAGLPADCLPAPAGPPGSPYQLGVVGTIRNGVLRTGSASVFGVSASFCGVVTVVAGQPPCAATGSVSSPADGQLFGSMSATLTLVPGMSPKVPFVAHPGTITGGFACQPSDGGLAVRLTATVSASAGLYGLSCAIGPLAIPLSGVLTGPLDHATVTLRGGGFPVPVVAASRTCPGAAPADLDAIAGLPIAAGGASVVLPATVSLYRPAG